MLAITKTMKTSLATAILLSGVMGASAQAADTLVVQGGAPVPYLGFLPIYVAEQAGFFKEEGLEVKVNYAANAGLATQLVVAGNGDMTISTFEPIAQGYDKGMRGKIFLQTNNSFLYYVGVPADSSIKSVQDLKGKKIGVSNLGSSAIPALRSLLDEAGVPHSSSTFLPVGVGSQAMAALNTGKVDALGLWDGIYFGLERGGAKLRYFHHPKLAGFGNFGFVTSNKTLKEKQQQLCAFGRAVGKATVFVLENPKAAVPMYWAGNPSAKSGGGDQEAFDKSLAEVTKIAATYGTLGDDQTYGAINEAGFAAYLGMLKEQGYINALPPVDDIATDSVTECSNQFDREKVRELARNWKG